MLANISMRACKFQQKQNIVCWQPKSLHSSAQVSQRLSVKTLLTLTTHICLFICLCTVISYKAHTRLRALHTLPYSPNQSFLQDRYYYPHFIDKEIEALRSYLQPINN